MGSVIDKLKLFRESLIVEPINIFQFNQQYSFTKDQIRKSIQFAVGSNATGYRSFHQVELHLRGVIHYLMGSQGYEPAEELLAVQQQSLWVTARYVLFMYQKYLQKVVPTNITYYHFMREKEFYTYFVALKYVMVVGFTQINQGKHVFMKLKNQQQVQLFKLLLQWLLTLIYYGESAIYIKSNCIDPLIKQAYLVLSTIIGFDNSSILSTLLENQIRDIFNKLFYINAFLLAIAVPTKNYLDISVIIAIIRKLLTSVARHEITTYLLSYIYAHLIGFIHTPYTHDVIYRLLLHFLIVKTKHKGHIDTVNSFIKDREPCQNSLIDCWSISSLLIEQFNLDKSNVPFTRDLILLQIKQNQNKSMIRGFAIKIIEDLHLDAEDNSLKIY